MHITHRKLWYSLLIILLVIVFINGQVTTTENEETSISIESTIFDTTETMTTTAEICDPDRSTGIKVTDRTSFSFTGLINYDCPLINSSEIIVFVNETLADNCYTNEDNNTINITCDPIENNAGRNWTFTIGRKNFLNETFTITLTPLSLVTSTNITVDIDDDVISADIFIPNCLDITDPEFVIFRCNSSDLSNNKLSDNCTYTCSNLEPGSIYHASLIRLPIPIVDENNNTFEEESIHTIYITNLDKVTNLTFNENSTFISFIRPRGNYDAIQLTCTAIDQFCSNGSKYLVNSTGNCSNCTSISISPITKGVFYECQAITIKQNFSNMTSDNLIFNTPLEPMIYERASQYWFSYSSQFTFNVTSQSDFDYIQSFCSIDQNETFPCSNITIDHEHCSTILNYKGIRGCNYQCYFITKKIDYPEKYSTNYTMQLYPPKPNLYISGKGSRSISTKWIFDEPVYVKSYQFLLDRRLVGTTTGEISSYNYTDLLPNQEYELGVHLIANQASTSEPITVRTLEEAPPSPSNNDINNKIIPLANDIESNSEQYAIEIDPSLFSNQYGIIRFYKIYVRQDQNKNTSKLDPIGSYSAAMKNESLDYLALNISLSSSTNYFRRSFLKLRIIIGNEGICKDDTNVSISCNGKLKADKNYKIVISACANPGCTAVLSKSFRTLKNPTTPSGSSEWVVIFPISIVLILAGLGIWKRKELKSFYYRKIKTSGLRGTSIEYQTKEARISLTATINEIRPKSLIQYVNMTHKVEKAIYAEYEELENMTSQHRQSTFEPIYAVYDRYKNIVARGSWNRTAVRLTGAHRSHDYINANEIKSYDNEKQYIACQGPLKNTCQDFWDMIVQYNVPTIVMLTKTDEQNPRNPTTLTSKCYQYFPTNVNQSFVFDRLVVKVIDVEFYHNSDLEIRHLIIKENGGNEYRLIHYFYTGWPDYNVIEPKKLLDLIETINKHREHAFNLYRKTIRTSLGPTVVHCSAGVGRTGVYIAVDTIMRLLDRPNRELLNMKLDVMGIVYQLRKDRGRMVQTKEQYMLINRCVEELLRQNRGLDTILKQSDVHENGNIRTPRSLERSDVDLSKPTSRIPSRLSTNDPSSMVEERSSSTHRMSNEIQRLSYDPLREKYHPTIDYEDTCDSTQPPIPPRRTKSRPSSTLSEQCDA